MLFSSWLFIGVFLPVVWLGYRMLSVHGGRRASLIWLTLASLFFYGWFRWDYVLIVIVSILFNRKVGNRLAATVHRGKTPARRALLVFGLLANLGALAYY